MLKFDLIVEILVTTSGGLSVLGTLAIIISYIKFREFNTFHLRLILYLALADFGSGATAIISTWARQDWTPLNCNLSAAAMHFFTMSSLLWTSAIAHTLDQVIRARNHHVSKFEKYYHLLCWGVPCGSVIFLSLTNKFGDADLWCWIPDSQKIWRFATFYIPLIIILLYNGITYLYVSYTLSQERKKISLMSDKLNSQDHKFSQSHTIQSTFRWFILGLIFCWMFAIANRAENIFSDKKIVWLFYLQAALVPLQGFVNSIIYGFNDEIQGKFFVLCCNAEAPSSFNETFSIQEEYEKLIFNRQSNNDEDPFNLYYSSKSIESTDTSYALKTVVPKEETQATLVLGPKGSGKTSFYNSLRMALNHPPIPIAPTFGASFFKFERNGIKWSLWDLGGGKGEKTWPDYFEDCDSIVYVMDATKKTEFDSDVQTLLQILTEPRLKGVPFIILLNKHDRPNAITEKNFRKKYSLPEDRPIQLKISSFVGERDNTKNTEVFPILDWIVEACDNDAGRERKKLIASKKE